MNHALLKQSLDSIACEIPGATRIFHAHKLDFYRGGQLSLSEAAVNSGISAEAIAAELDAIKAPEDEAMDWRTAADAELISHILARYHSRHREQLPELIRLAQRVEQVHGDHDDCPAGLTDLLRYMQQELESHMLKEEQILFPALLDGLGPRALAPISVMRMEHEHHGEAIQRLLTITQRVTPPHNACSTWGALYRGLDEFIGDLMQHIHLENNVLFTNALNPATKQAAKP